MNAQPKPETPRTISILKSTANDQIKRIKLGVLAIELERENATLRDALETLQGRLQVAASMGIALPADKCNSFAATARAALVQP